LPPSSPRVAGQLALPIRRERRPDRNHDKGGRSFYFFDLDDNVLRLCTSIFLFDKKGGAERAVSTRHFAEIAPLIGRRGEWARFEVRDDDRVGSFRRFRDHEAVELGGRPQPFFEDVQASLAGPQAQWQGPSWSLFEHAVYNERALAIITARGHHPETMKAGLALLHASGHLHALPSYLGVYPVTHHEVRARLGDPEAKLGVPRLKHAAIFAAVDDAMRLYGENPYHRFGVSDDDPRNLEHIMAALTELKARYPDNAFFVIDSSRDPLIKTEVLAHSIESAPWSASEQLELGL